MTLSGANAAARRERLSEMTDFCALLACELPASMRPFHDERNANHE